MTECFPPCRTFAGSCNVSGVPWSLSQTFFRKCVLVLKVNKLALLLLSLLLLLLLLLHLLLLSLVVCKLVRQRVHKVSLSVQIIISSESTSDFILRSFLSQLIHDWLDKERTSATKEIWNQRILITGFFITESLTHTKQTKHPVVNWLISSYKVIPLHLTYLVFQCAFQRMSVCCELKPFVDLWWKKVKKPGYSVIMSSWIAAAIAQFYFNSFC